MYNYGRLSLQLPTYVRELCMLMIENGPKEATTFLPPCTEYLPLVQRIHTLGCMSAGSSAPPRWGPHGAA